MNEIKITTENDLLKGAVIQLVIEGVTFTIPKDEGYLFDFNIDNVVNITTPPGISTAIRNGLTNVVDVGQQTNDSSN